MWWFEGLDGLPAQEYAMQFLMGLNESYAGICGQILMIDPLPLVSKVFNLIVQESDRVQSGLDLPLWLILWLSAPRCPRISFRLQ